MDFDPNRRSLPLNIYHDSAFVNKAVYVKN